MLFHAVFIIVRLAVAELLGCLNVLARPVMMSAYLTAVITACPFAVSDTSAFDSADGAHTDSSCVSLEFFSSGSFVPMIMSSVTVAVVTTALAVVIKDGALVKFGACFFVFDGAMNFLRVFIAVVRGLLPLSQSTTGSSPYITTAGVAILDNYPSTFLGLLSLAILPTALEIVGVLSGQGQNAGRKHLLAFKGSLVLRLVAVHLLSYGDNIAAFLVHIFAVVALLHAFPHVDVWLGAAFRRTWVILCAIARNAHAIFMVYILPAAKRMFSFVRVVLDFVLPIVLNTIVRRVWDAVSPFGLSAITALFAFQAGLNFFRSMHALLALVEGQVVQPFVGNYAAALSAGAPFVHKTVPTGIATSCLLLMVALQAAGASALLFLGALRFKFAASPRSKTWILAGCGFLTFGWALRLVCRPLGWVWRFIGPPISAVFEKFHQAVSALLEFTSRNPIPAVVLAFFANIWLFFLFGTRLGVWHGALMGHLSSLAEALYHLALRQFSAYTYDSCMWQPEVLCGMVLVAVAAANNVRWEFMSRSAVMGRTVVTNIAILEAEVEQNSLAFTRAGVKVVLVPLLIAEGAQYAGLPLAVSLPFIVLYLTCWWLAGSFRNVPRQCTAVHSVRELAVEDALGHFMTPSRLFVCPKDDCVLCLESMFKQEGTVKTILQEANANMPVAIAKLDSLDPSVCCLPCGHAYHKACVITALKSTPQFRRACFLCRRPLTYRHAAAKNLFA